MQKDIRLDFVGLLEWDLTVFPQISGFVFLVVVAGGSYTQQLPEGLPSQLRFASAPGSGLYSGCAGAITSITVGLYTKPFSASGWAKLRFSSIPPYLNCK